MAGTLVLASASPQRRAILEQIGIPFSVRVSGVEEETHGDPSAVAEENARRKAAAIDYAHFKEGVPAMTLGADTLVAVDGDILGKPADAAQAREYVARLAGRTHQVVGAIVLMYAGNAEPAVAVEITQVHFRPASDATLDWYVADRRVGGPRRRLRHPGRRRRARRGHRGRLPQRRRPAAPAPPGPRT